MIMFFSGTGKGSILESGAPDIDVMMTFFDMWDRPPLPKFTCLVAARRAKWAQKKSKKKSKKSKTNKPSE